MTNSTKRDPGIVELFLMFMGGIVMIISVVGALGITEFMEFFSDPLSLRMMLLFLGVSMGLTEVVTGWLLTKRERK